MANRLADQTSPYLLQHAENPVDWYPWGEEALEKARSEDKPILLSIGYSACHWCHVMAHESFEDEDVAALINRLFVNIKVDREERPELDKIYQLSHQILAQRPGGWPLTMFLAPDQTPFFGGTYFPKEARFGMPGFPDLLERVAAYYAEHAEEIRKQNQALKDFFVELSGRGAEKMASELDDRALAHCREVLEQEFDDRFGGFGQAPKFPHPTSISRLLRHWHRTAPTTEPDKQALYMAAATLTRMAMGGIYDQLGGGFCRYSVDDLWMIPHFEKMLYDNGPLLGIYAQAGRATGEHAFARTAAETAGWVMREMESPEGGYYASLDADSEGEEGRYYVWDRTEVQALLGADYDLFAARYGLDREPNFEGRWHLHVYEDEQSLASRFRLDQDEVRRRMDEARQRLLAVRDARVRPGCDDKVLVAWNGMMVRGMAQAARHLERPELSRSAARAVDFIRNRLWSGGRLRTAWRDGRAGADGLLDDYALLLDGILELLQARWDSQHLGFAVELAEALLTHFRDEASGAFFFTPHDHEELIHRPLPLADDATPSGNGVAAYALQRLGHLLGETRYLEAAEDVLKAAKADMEKIPQAHTSLMDALEEALDPPETIVIRGDEAELGTWHQAVSPWYMPRRQIFAIPTCEELPGLLAERKASDEGPIAYVCKGMQCDAPVRSLEALVHLVGVPA